MKTLGYLGMSVISGAILSMAMISGCNSEEAPPATPPATPSAAATPEGGPKMEPATPPAGDAAKPAEAKK